MSAFARLMYRALVWKERQRAKHARRSAEGLDSASKHLELGERGETLAYWFLRQAGYTIVARNRRARSRAGELDLVGWDGPILSFVEVKTRASLAAGPPEAAVSRSKQKKIARAAREYLQRLKRKPLSYRFDIVSVAWEPEAGLQVRLIKDAFRTGAGG
jgi:putative endonuclease